MPSWWRLFDIFGHKPFPEIPRDPSLQLGRRTGVIPGMGSPQTQPLPGSPGGPSPGGPPSPGRVTPLQHPSGPPPALTPAQPLTPPPAAPVPRPEPIVLGGRSGAPVPGGQTVDRPGVPPGPQGGSPNNPVPGPEPTGWKPRRLRPGFTINLPGTLTTLARIGTRANPY